MKQGVSRRSLIKGTASVAALGVLGAPRVARADDGPIKIGFPVPITGPFGAEAKDQVKSADLAVKQFNAAGGLNGRLAELMVRDDKLNPGEAATRTLELIEKDKVDILTGLSASGMAASTQARKASTTGPRPARAISGSSDGQAAMRSMDGGRTTTGFAGAPSARSARDTAHSPRRILRP